MEVTLDKFEMIQAGLIGVIRQAESISRKHRNKFAPPEDPFGIHVLGSMGEMAAAKALGMYYGGTVNQFKKPDIGELYQIRTSNKPDQPMVVRDGDADDEVFIMVTGPAPTFTLKGWLWGKEAKKEKYIRNPGGRGPAYFVGQDELHPMSELPAGGRGER